MYRDRVGGIPAYTADVATSGGRALVRPETVEVRTEVTDARRLGRRPGWLTDLLVIIARRPVHIYKQAQRPARAPIDPATGRCSRVVSASDCGVHGRVKTRVVHGSILCDPTQPNPTHYK